MKMLVRWLLKLIPKSLLLNLSFHNFENAITACYMSAADFQLLRVNKAFLELFDLKLAQIKNLKITDVMRIIGMPDEQIKNFTTVIKRDSFVRFDAIKIASAKGAKYFSLFSTYTRHPYLPFLCGAQGQFIDRTNEILLKFKTEELTKFLSEKQAEIVQQNKNLEALATKLAKYLSPQVYGSIFTGKTPVSIEFKRKKLTVFFSDIKNFTPITENLESEDLAHLLNQYLDAMAKIALKHGGTIDKFIGDAILIFFGDPESKGEQADALSCIKMAMEMRNYMQKLRHQWVLAGVLEPLHVRMGVNTGYCTVGNFGSEERLDYTIIGGQVNLAARLEQSAKPDSILISHETYSLIRHLVYCEPAGEILVKGISRKVRVYEPIDFYQNIQQPGEIVRKESDGFSLELEPNAITNFAEVAQALKDALALLETRYQSLRPHE